MVNGQLNGPNSPSQQLGAVPGTAYMTAVLGYEGYNSKKNQTQTINSKKNKEKKLRKSVKNQENQRKIKKKQ